MSKFNFAYNLRTEVGNPYNIVGRDRYIHLAAIDNDVIAYITYANTAIDSLEKVIYYVSYVVIEPGETGFQKLQVITDAEYREAVEKFGTKTFIINIKK